MKWLLRIAFVVLFIFTFWIAGVATELWMRSHPRY
jgi:phage shock protein PspC (stress-responsive transcriptional regulator)